MGVTVQVRDLDPAVNDRLKAEASARGISYSEYLRRELTRIAEKMRIDDRWAELASERETGRQTNARPRDEAWKPVDVDTETIVRWIREDRDGR
jgi:hypothetical protein